MSKPRTDPAQPVRRRLLQVAVASCFATAVHANPVGPSVVSGAATFNAVGKNLTVTNSPGAIINWQGFAIRPDEVTRFVQSGAASAVLNRVTGPEQSAILGQLASNGRVFLINPNGVTIGAGARIDTAGFVASSLNLSNEDFLAGKFRFTDPGNAGKVTNAGTINAHSGGPVYLVAPSVENHGVITAPGGDVILAAGKTVELVSLASPDIRVQVQAGGEALNVGQLVAESGRVGIFGAAIRNAGAVSADGAELTTAGTIVLRASKDVTLEATSTLTANGAKGGAITVQAEGGTLLADGRVEAKGTRAAGGEVRLLGEQVGLIGQASVDASGRAGGGTVLVGGDYQGKNPDVQNAKASYVGADATIKADATDAGDGGKVIVWADGATRFLGAASARGGASSGDGGFVEVSGKDWLAFTGTVDTSAAAGRAGTLLLDPTDITISAAATSNGTCPPAGPCFTLTGNPATANLSVANLLAALANTNVTVNTASTALSQGDITVANAVSYAGATARTLTLTANRDITLNAGVGSTNGALTLNFNAGRNYAQAAAAPIVSRRGNVAVTAGGAAALGGIDTNTGAAATPGNLSVTSNGAITQAGGTTLDVRGQATLSAGAANSITLANATNNFRANVQVLSGNNVSLRDANAIQFGGGASTVSGNLDVTTAGAVTQTAALAVAGTTTLAAGAANNITLANAANDFGTVAVTSGNAVTLVDANAIALGASAVSGALSVTAGGPITDSGALAVTGATTLTAGAANSITLDNANNFVGAVRIVSGNNVTLNDVNALQFAAAASTISGNLAVTTAGAVTQGAAGVTVGGTTSINAGAGNDITLNNAANNFGGAVSASGRNVNLRDTNAMVLGTVTANGAGSVITLQAGGPVTQTGVVTAPQLTATLAGAASALNLGTVANNVGQLNAVTAPGGVNLNNGNNNLVVNGNVTATNNAVSIATGTASYTQNNFDVIAGTGAITVTADTVNIVTPNTGTNAFQTSGTLTLKPASAGRAMSLAGASGFDLTTAEVTALAGGVTAAGNIVIGDAAASTGTMTIGAPVSFGAKTVTLNAGAFTDGNTVSPVTATSLALNARNAGASIGAAGANNAIDVTVTNLRVNTNNGDAYVRATGAVNLGPAASTLGTGGLNLTANGAITQSGAITATGTSTLAAGAANNITLANAANDFGTAAVTSGNAVTLVDANAIALGASSVGTIRGQALAGNLTVNGAISATGAGNSIVLAAANNFVNNAGAAALDPGAGRWVVYSTNPAGNTFGGLASGNQAIWNATFAGNPPGTIPAGNRYLFSQQPTATFTSTDAAKIYGDDATAAIAGNFTATGFVNAAAFGGVFTQDTAANTFTGAPSVTSAGAPPIADVGLYPITLAAGTLAPTTGYAMAFNPAGQLTVNQRPITVTPGPLARQYGDPNPTTTGTLTVGGAGLANGNTIAQVNVASPATATDPAGSVHALNGSNAVFGGGGLASNYAITYSPGTLTITLRPITVRANDQNRAYGDPNPTTGPFTLVSGTLAGTDTIGTVNVTSPATAAALASSVWVLTNTGANFTSGAASNYAITLQNGQLTITPAALTIAADNKVRLYGDPNPPLTATFTGLTNGDTSAAIPGVTLTTPATITSNVGPYAINVTSGANSNYTITYVNGQLVITPAPLTIAADDKTKTAGQPNPPFTATFTGFKLGQTVADLTGALSFTTPAATGSPAGSYPIAPGGVSSTNYVITFVDGQLLVNTVPIPPRPAGGAVSADNALITATQRSESSPTEGLQPDAPLVRSTDCLVLETPAGRRVLNRCF